MASKFVIFLILILDLIAFGLAVAAERRRSTSPTYGRGIQTLAIAAQQTNSQDYVVLMSLKHKWENTPPNWVGTEPCGDRWEGIACYNGRVTEIKLSGIKLKGRLTGDIPNLSELETLRLDRNSLSGPVPSNINNLTHVHDLYLSNNKLCG